MPSGRPGLDGRSTHPFWMLLGGGRAGSRVSGGRLALGGARGGEHVLRTLLAEADLIMAVDGYPTRADLTPDALRRVNAGA